MPQWHTTVIYCGCLLGTEASAAVDLLEISGPGRTQREHLTRTVRMMPFPARAGMLAAGVSRCCSRHRRLLTHDVGKYVQLLTAYNSEKALSIAGNINNLHSRLQQQVRSQRILGTLVAEQTKMMKRFKHFALCCRSCFAVGGEFAGQAADVHG